MWGPIGGCVLGILLFLVLGGMEICALNDEPVSTVPFDPSDPTTWDLPDRTECNGLVREVNAAVAVLGGAFGAALGWAAQALYQNWDELVERVRRLL